MFFYLILPFIEGVIYYQPISLILLTHLLPLPYRGGEFWLRSLFSV